MKKPSWKQGTPLDDKIQERLRALIKERGETATAELIGISKISVVRAAAGSGVRGVTAIAIEARLAAIKTPKPPRAA